MATTLPSKTSSTRSRKPDAASAYQCTECGTQFAKWIGRCSECQTWGSVEERGAAKSAPKTVASMPAQAARPIGEVDVQDAAAVPTGIGELDRVLGGGLVPGAVVLLAGEPGIGKSTLLLEAAAAYAQTGARTLVVTGEESAAQVRLRADRIGALSPNLYLAAETDLGSVLGQVEGVQPRLLIVDSVQTIASAAVDGTPGGVTQVREVAAALIRDAKERNMACVLVGHVTKDGSIAGPRILEHLVDVVLQFEGDRATSLRMIRAAKNRYGPSDEIGCFEMHDSGIRGLEDPSGLFLSRRPVPVPGTCVTVTLEGRRPLVAEVQALVTKSSIPAPRRASSGLDTNRVAMILAVLQQRGGIGGIATSEIYSATVGGVRLTEPAADLALLLALASATVNEPVGEGVVAIGEVGLAGEVRPVTGVKRRLAEAARLGFKTALVPPDPEGKAYAGNPSGLKVVEVSDVRGALHAVATGTRR
jgi:DNA repair protein RadA/Sms